MLNRTHNIILPALFTIVMVTTTAINAQTPTRKQQSGNEQKTRIIVDESLKAKLDSAFTEALAFLLKDPCKPNQEFISQKSKELAVLARKANINDGWIEFDMERKKRTACEIQTNGQISKYNALFLAIIDDKIQPCNFTKLEDYENELSDKRNSVSANNYDAQMQVNVRNYIWARSRSRRGDDRQSRGYRSQPPTISENAKCLLNMIDKLLRGPIRPD